MLFLAFSCYLVESCFSFCCVGGGGGRDENTWIFEWLFKNLFSEKVIAIVCFVNFLSCLYFKKQSFNIFGVEVKQVYVLVFPKTVCLKMLSIASRGNPLVKFVAKVTLLAYFDALFSEPQ